MEVGELWMHQPVNHSSEAFRLVQDLRCTRRSISNDIEEKFSQSADLEDLARSRRIAVTEPFAGLLSPDGCIGVLGPSKMYYESLIPAILERSNGIRRGSRQHNSLLGLRRPTRESWYNELLMDPDANAVSPMNNSSVILLLGVDGDRVLLTSDAGVPALTNAVGLAIRANINLTACRMQQVPHHGSRRNLGPSLLNLLVGRIQPPNLSTKMTVFCSAAEDALKHPRPRVKNAYIRRGCSFHSTKGRSIWFYRNAPSRANYSPLVNEPFLEVYDDPE